MDKRLLLAHIAMFMVALFYASNFTIAKPVMSTENGAAYVTPFGFIMLRVIAATVLFWIAQLFVQKEKIDRTDWWRIFLCAACGIAGNQLAFFYGLQMTTPINGALIMLTTPIIVLIVSSFVFKEKLTALKLGGISLGLIGAIVLIYSNKGVIPDASNPTLGNIFIGINAVFYACYLILVKPLMTKYSPITVLKWIFLIGIFYVIPFGASDALAIEWGDMPTEIILAIGYVLFFVTFMTYILNGSALKVVKPSVNSAYIYLQPLLATIIAVGAGKDSLNGLMIVAGVLIFVGVFMVSKKTKAVVESQPLPSTSNQEDSLT
jgi:drug/metabolite transporter (DMT)-like permease